MPPKTTPKARKKRRASSASSASSATTTTTKRQKARKAPQAIAPMLASALKGKAKNTTPGSKGEEEKDGASPLGVEEIEILLAAGMYDEECV